VYFETLEQVYAHIQSHEVEHGLKYIIRSSSVGFGDDGWYWPPPLLLFIILSVNDDMHTAGSVHSQNAGTGRLLVVSNTVTFPSIRTEVKCNYLLFSVRTDGNLYAYIRYFPSVQTEIYT